MRRFLRSRAGYTLLTAVIAVNIFAVLILKARVTWNTMLQRDLEAELLFRARQYVVAIELFQKKNVNKFPQTLEELYEKKFLRKLFKDPMTPEGKWNLVMRGGGQTQQKGLLIVPEDMVDKFSSTASIVGVCSTSPEESFLVYRKKKRYNEWAVFLGEQMDKEMPELNFVGADGKVNKTDSSDSDSGSDSGRGSKPPPGQQIPGNPTQVLR